MWGKLQLNVAQFCRADPQDNGPTPVSVFTIWYKCEGRTRASCRGSGEPPYRKRPVMGKLSDIELQLARSFSSAGMACSSHGRSTRSTTVRTFPNPAELKLRAS